MVAHEDHLLILNLSVLRNSILAYFSRASTLLILNLSILCSSVRVCSPLAST